MTASAYINFQEGNLIQGYEKETMAIRISMIFKQDNALSHPTKVIMEYLSKIRFKNGSLIEWPAYSPDLNPIENL